MSWVGLVVALLLGWLARGHWERAAMCRHCDVGEGALLYRTYICDDCNHVFEVRVSRGLWFALGVAAAYAIQAVRQYRRDRAAAKKHREHVRRMEERR